MAISNSFDRERNIGIQCILEPIRAYHLSDMEYGQGLPIGPSCKKYRRPNMRGDQAVPCETCIGRGIQSCCPDRQLSRTNQSSALVGLDQQSHVVYGHMQTLEHASQLATSQGGFPLLAGNPMNNPQDHRSAAPTQSWEPRPHPPEYMYPSKWDSAPGFHSDSPRAVGMNANPLRGGSLPEGGLAMETGCPPSSSRTNTTPGTPNFTSYNYIYEGRSQDSAEAPSTTAELRFSELSRPLYHHPYMAFPFLQGQSPAILASLGAQIEREAPSASGVPQFNGLPLPREVEASSMSAQASPVIGLEMTWGGSSGSHLGLSNLLQSKQLRGESIYDRAWESASSKEPARSPARQGRRSAAIHVRARPGMGREHYPYRDDKLRSKYPKQRHDALELAIKFQKEHGRTKAIPPDLLDDLLDQGTDGKYSCFCCPHGRREATTVTPARDHVRKSLGNFPFRCSNAWCNHSSLRQADLNKHLKTCISQTSSNPTSATGAMAKP